MSCIAASVAILLISWEAVFITGSTGARCPSACCKMIQAVTERVTALEDAGSSAGPSTPTENGWELVFSAKAESKLNVLDSWKASDDINPNDTNAEMFKSPLAEEWGLRPVDQVRIELTTQMEVKAYYIFDGRGSSKETFFSRDNLLASSHRKLKGDERAKFYLDAGGSHGLNFIIIDDLECGKNVGWQLVVDWSGEAFEGRSCEWMNITTSPYCIYCEAEGSCNLQNAPHADTFRILYKFA